MTQAQNIIMLLEAFASSFHVGKDYVEIFANPDRKEWRDSGQDIRFVLDAREKKFYIANGWNVTHDWIAQRLHKNLLDSWMFFGDITYQKGHVTVERFSLKPSLVDYDLSWADWYDLDLKPYIRVHWFPDRPPLDWI